MKKNITSLVILVYCFYSQGQSLIQATGSSNNFNVNIGANFGGQYQSGHMFCFISNQTITGPATLAINGMSPQSILKNLDQPLASGEIVNGQSVCVIYDGTNFQLNSPTIPTFVVTSSTGWVTTTFGLNYDANGSVVVRGTINTGPIYDITQASTATWFQYAPRKGALKIGRADATSWLDANTGRYTFSSGDRNRAGANNSAAIGGTLNIIVTSSGVNSVAIGGANSTIIGNNAISLGTNLSIPSYGEVSMGLFNRPYSGTPNTSIPTDQLFSIGNGTGVGAESNALVVLKNGNIGINNVDNPTATLDIN
ncbi:MAG: hypothetical protein EAZ53_05865 [Bacteroidetes bacterium]|nr:MAG: hypothetical protein EAZ53_05865 [Bacteroidota bacterium]